MNRAYSLFEIKTVNEDKRIIEGIASTISVDRMDDIVEPRGAQIKLPTPLLWQHDSRMPVGSVTAAKVSDKSITVTCQFAKVDEPPSLKDDLDRAWAMVKAGLVRGFSIGFSPIESTDIEGTWGRRFVKWELLELSCVTIPANAEASITTVRSFDQKQRAASGQAPVLKPPGVSGNHVNPSTPKEGIKVKTLQELITELETARGPKMARLEEISQKSVAEGRRMTEAEGSEYDPLDAEVSEIDADLRRLKSLLAKSGEAKTVVARTLAEGSQSRGGAVFPVVKEKPEPGVAFARLVKVKAVSQLEIRPQLSIAEKMYGRDSETFAIVEKTGEVLPGTAASGNWGVDLISAEGAAVADFVEYLRKASITGKFGTAGIPNLHRIGFYEPYVIQTGAGVGYWVGEAKPIPLTSFDFDRSTLTPLKLGNMAMLSERNIRYSSPASDVIIRDQLARLLVETEDMAFIDPANSGTSNIKPASVTNGAETIVSTGDDPDDVRMDMRALMKKFTDASNPPRQGVFVMSTDNALSLSSMVNAFGQPEFTGISMDGGRLFGLPVIVSDHAGTIVALINASDIYYSDEGGVQVDVSREASIEMKNQANITQDGGAATGAAMVSTFQNMLVALRAVKTVNWKLRRSTGVAYLTSVSWGGAVPAS